MLSIPGANAGTYCRIFSYTTGNFKILAEANETFPVIDLSGNVNAGTILIVAFTDDCNKCNGAYNLVGSINFRQYIIDGSFLI